MTDNEQAEFQYNSKNKYLKLFLFPNGMKCPKCGGSHFHPKATILPDLLAVAPDKNGKDGKVSLWVARSDCLISGCNGFLDWTLHPDYLNGYGSDWQSIVEWGSNPLALDLYKDYPRSK